MTMFPRILSILLVVLISPASAVACMGEKTECGPFTSWYEANFLEIHMLDNQGRGSARWTISIDKEINDVIIEKDELFQGERAQGTVMILSGRVMLTNGLDLKEGYEIDAADAPALMMQLLLNLLGLVAPDGPNSLKPRFTLNHREQERPIKVSTASASGVFGVPWTAKGILKKPGKNNVEFEIAFESMLRGELKYAVELKGQWEIKQLERLRDSMSLEGWKIYTIGPYEKKYKSGTILDYGARIRETDAPTIGALRNEIETGRKPPHEAPRATR